MASLGTAGWILCPGAEIKVSVKATVLSETWVLLPSSLVVGRIHLLTAVRLGPRFLLAIGGRSLSATRGHP